MKVLLTTDVELWPRKWDLSERELTRAFRHYILGETSRGEVGLGFQLRLLAEHDHRGVFFVEPLFASVMGQAALEEIVGMIQAAGQEVQLHAHTEWLGRAGCSELPGPPRMSVKDLSEKEQGRVIGIARDWLTRAGAPTITAFRAGAFGADRATLRALARLGIPMDSSHNPVGSRGPLDSGLREAVTVIERILEIPQTVYHDAVGRCRPAQIGSSSTAELCETMEQALWQGRSTYVILNHSAELLTGDRERPDRVAVTRFEKLCRHLADHREHLPTAGFTELKRNDITRGSLSPGLTTSVSATATRYAEQVLRRVI